MITVSQAATAKHDSVQPSEGVVDIAGAQQLIKGAQTTPPVTSGN